MAVAAAAAVWDGAARVAVPEISLVGVARADDDDGGGGGGFRGGRGFGINGIGIPRMIFGGIPRLKLFRGGPRRAARAARRPAAASVATRPGPAREFVVAGLAADDLARLAERGFDVTATRSSGILGRSVSRIEPPRRLGISTALRQIRELAPLATAARNDTYRRSPIAPYRPQEQACGAACEAFVLTGWRPDYLRCAISEAIGVVDTGVDPAHPALAGASVELATVRRADRPPSNPAHGTGVVSLLVGQPGSEISGVVPRARVFAVDAFHAAGPNDATDAYDLLAALDHLAERRVRIVNMSLAGPDNALLASAVATLVERGATLIAAAGPAAGKDRGYPAKYPGVVAVAAVDTRLNPSRLSARGAHIAIAGPGVGLSVAAPGGRSRLATGTSFAAPIVAAAFAAAKGEAGGDRTRTLERISALARDLGPPGRDAVFGWGLVQFPALGGC